MRLLTQNDLVKIFGINKPAIMALASLGKIPYKGVFTDSDTMRFCPDAIASWIREGVDLAVEDNFIEKFKNRLWTEHPNEMRAIKKFGNKFTSGYCGRRASPKMDLYKMLESYYERDSTMLLIDAKRGRVLSNKLRAAYHGFIRKRFVPYLKRNRVRDVGDIDTATLAKFQNHLLLENMQPQTVNVNMSGIKMAFEHFAINGYIKLNPCAGLPSLRQPETQARGCYEIARLKGVFGKKWENARHHLLCMLIYTTGMRNSEIARIQKSDIIEIEGCRFIDIPRSKSKNGVRVIPLHEFVYEKLMAYPSRAGGYVLSGRGTIDNKIFAAANLSLAEFTGYDAKTLDRERISFYSGRHFYKTLMNSENLGEVEEYFMGHRVSGDVAKRYNHRDKQGKEKLAQKAREVFAVLDKCLFAGS